MAGEQDETSEDLVIDVVDFQGTRVVCDVQRWTAKVDEHHFELIGAYAEVSETIANPDTVLQDRDYGNRLHHIRRLPGNLHTVVVVEYEYLQGVQRGRLVTAFRRRRFRRGDHVVYLVPRR